METLGLDFKTGHAGAAPAREEDIKKLHKAFKKDASSSYLWHAGQGLHAGAVRVPVLPAGSEGIKSAQQQAQQVQARWASPDLARQT
eukprot:s322_g15.t1